MADPEQVLIVEDDVDIAELLGELLTQEGYAVTLASNAAQGLAQLRSRRFVLVLSDHRMPGQTGLAMLQEAEREGLLAGVAVLIVSAEADALRDSPWPALRKPVDFDVLLDEVHRAVVARVAPEEPLVAATENASVMPVLKLVLYVTATSASSRRAQRNLERVLAQYDVAAVAVTMIDLSRDADAVDPEDRVAFTPTLVRRSPEPRAWLLGDLRDLGAVRSLLEDAGVARRTS
ncbi:MAG TPA: response regulator [Nannocystis sp.]|jgi:DNA-binding NtrC family response regulator